MKNLGRSMPESVVRNELESLNIRVQGVTQLRSGLRDQDQSKDRPPNTHIIKSVARRPEVSKVRSLTDVCSLRFSMESYVSPKGLMQWKRCQSFVHTQRNCAHAPRCVACGGAQPTGGCSTTWEQPQCCNCGGNHKAKYRGCVKLKEEKAAVAKLVTKRSQKSVS